MKTRQFRRLAGLPGADRVDMVVEGLRSVGANVLALAFELEKCNEVKALRSARLLYNAGREEAGKFLVLIDAWRAPGAKQRLLSRQFARAGVHLSKLIYAQIADYSIASQAELLSAIERHRQALYLDGPNDYDWIFRNDLLWERESAMYVDLVDGEGQLEWWVPREEQMRIPVPFSIRLVTEVLSSGLVSNDGLRALQDAWRGFDPSIDSHCQSWVERTAAALASLPEKNVQDGELNQSARFVAQRWPMPLVELEIEEKKMTVEGMVEERDRAYAAWLRYEFGGDEY